MVSRENPIFGRKIFFVNPPMGFDVSVIKKLREADYEAYIIPDFLYLKSILRHNEDALCFIDIDGGFSVNEWFNYIRSFKLEDKLRSIFVGVLSGYASTGERGKFLINLQLPGGFIQLNQSPEDLVKQLVGILEINGAKGRRQYIRLNCQDYTDINGYMAIKDNLFAFNIENISSVGFACSYNPREVNNFQKNTVYKNISLTIGKKSIACPSVVFDTRIQNDKGFSVMLFTKEVPSSNRTVINNYIFTMLDAALRKELSLAMPDYTDYTIAISDGDIPDYELPPEAPPPKIGDVEIPKPDDANAEDIEEVEEVEEVAEAEDAEAAEAVDDVEEVAPADDMDNIQDINEI